MKHKKIEGSILAGEIDNEYRRQKFYERMQKQKSKNRKSKLSKFAEEYIKEEQNSIK